MITSADLLVKFSTKNGSAGNSQSGTASGSLGKYISTTEITDATLHNLFDIISGIENVNGDIEYRCIFLQNAHATLTYYTAKVYIISEASGGATIQIGLDTNAISAIGGTTQAVEITNEDTAPVGVAFSAPTTSDTGLLIGDIGPGQCKAIWIQRTIDNTAPKTNDNVVLGFIGDSEE